MDVIQPTLTIIASLAGLAGSVFVLRKAFGWLFPISIKPSIFVDFQEPNKDKIRAIITNRSREPLYVVKCDGRSANKLSYIVRKHVSRPLTKPRLYQCIWFGASTYALMDSEPIKLDPGQPIELSRELNFLLPIFAFTNPMVQVEVALSNGRVFRSRRLPIPVRWHVSHHIAEKRRSTENA